MKQEKWFNRKFDFSTQENIFPSIIERLAGTPARFEEKFRSIPPDIQSVRLNGSWTIKENLGHLIDLEPLWQGRFDDIMNGEREMRPTDLQNRKTSEANHDAVPIEELLRGFRDIRTKTMKLIQELTDEQVFKTSIHPRLKTPMRVMDLFFLWPNTTIII
ncbi:MAG TPA: DinB family protein [Parafilimonas sp.]|nr:DinB family protein [Parafilimonas sp.]